MEPLLCSIPEAAQTLAIGRTKLYQMLADGELMSAQIGARRLVTVESINALVDRITGTSA